MQTVTMQDIAELAQVKRPVVSVWRTRLAASDRPFPEPEQEHPLRFDAAKVARWLQETGHGNNADAHLESALHSTALQCVTNDADGASALLLLHALRGEPLGDLTPPHAVIEAHEIGAVLDEATAGDALGDVKLRQAIDELAEAAFSAERVLDRLLGSFVAPGGPWVGEALTSAAEDLLATVLTEVHRAAPRQVVPAGPGGVLMVTALAARLEEHEELAFGCRRETLERPCDRAAWRRLAARGLRVTAYDDDTAAGSPAGCSAGVLHLLQWQDVAGEADFFDQVEDLLVDLDDRDAVVVVGPARLMTDRPGEHGRRRLLTPSPGYTAPLRYVARMPTGLSRHGGRRRLALWVFGTPASTWTVAGSHSDTRTDPASAMAIAADVAASISKAVDLRDHAFHSSAVLASDRFLRRPTLTAPATNMTVVNGGEQLARVWELDSGLLDGIDLAAAPARPAHISLARAASELGRELPGTRIPAEHIDTPEPGWAVLIGPDEIRDPARIGDRGVDRLTLEEVAPRAKLTKPGDVIYVAAGGPATIVDQHGGHVVQAPARVFRCHDAEVDDRQLVPAVVAADIAAQPGTDRRTWLLRTVQVDRARALTEAACRTETRRQRLLTELRTLDALETEVINGLAAGSLSATINPPAPTKAEI